MRAASPLGAMFRKGSSHSLACAGLRGCRDTRGRKERLCCRSVSMRTSGGQVRRLKGPRACINITTHPLNRSQGHPKFCVSSGIHLVLVTVSPYAPDSDLEMQKSCLALPSPSSSLPWPVQPQDRATANPYRLLAIWERHPFPKTFYFHLLENCHNVLIS